MSNFLSGSSDEGDTVQSLKSQLAEETAKRTCLEEELDLLAFENMQLRRQIQAMKDSATGASGEGGPAAPAETLPAAEAADYGSLLEDGDNGFARSPQAQYPNVCGGANVLSAKYLTVPGEQDILVCGGVDKKIRGVDMVSKQTLFDVAVAAPVLAISCCGNMIACGMMDGSFAIVEVDVAVLRTGNSDGAIRTWLLKEHNKYVVDIRWSEDGRFLATASHDQSVLMFAVERTVDVTDAPSPLRQLSRRRFESVPESISFLNGQLLIAVRNSHQIVVINCHTLDESLFSMNGNSWDTHVSFNALFLSVSPDQKSFSVSTDNSLHLIFRLENSKRLRTLSAHTCGNYGKPKVSWDCSGQYIVSNSESDFGVHVYSVGSERVVFSGDATTGGHRGQVRDIDCHKTRRTFVSASFDHSVIEWGHE